jgi:hypothetical protein
VVGRVGLTCKGNDELYRRIIETSTNWPLDALQRVEAISSCYDERLCENSFSELN